MPLARSRQTEKTPTLVQVCKHVVQAPESAWCGPARKCASSKTHHQLTGAHGAEVLVGVVGSLSKVPLDDDQSSSMQISSANPSTIDENANVWARHTHASCYVSGPRDVDHRARLAVEEKKIWRERLRHNACVDPRDNTSENELTEQPAVRLR